jgi:hypothetical protein
MHEAVKLLNFCEYCISNSIGTASTNRLSRRGGLARIVVGKRHYEVGLEQPEVEIHKAPVHLGAVVQWRRRGEREKRKAWASPYRVVEFCHAVVTMTNIGAVRRKKTTDQNGRADGTHAQ